MHGKLLTANRKYVDLPANGKGLDVGYGSAALTIAAAKRNRQAEMTGLDRWGKEYASFSKVKRESPEGGFPQDAPEGMPEDVINLFVTEKHVCYLVQCS